jgi:ABC-type lipoprotein release transport system permease subunit
MYAALVESPRALPGDLSLVFHQPDRRRKYSSDMYLQLGWRNIWRNPRRTTVILLAIIIGVWSMLFLGALMRGVSEQLIRNGIQTLTGHIQVHAKGYRDDPVVDHRMTDPQALAAALAGTLPPGAQWAPRVRVNAVASNARYSAGVTLVGIDPPREARISFVGRAVHAGRYLESNDETGILLGKALVEEFETQPGHKIVLMSQDTGGEIASRAFRITGIFRAELEATEKQYVFVSLPAAQKMLKLGPAISEAAVLLPGQGEESRVAAALQSRLSQDAYEVQTWQELLPIVTAVQRLYDGFIFLWFLVVFIAMGFGIINTTLMAVFERIREFGLLRALGMKPAGVVKAILTESFFLLVIGMLAGNVLGAVTVSALANTGIDLSFLAQGMEYAGLPRIIYPSVYARDAVLANLVVLVLGLLVSLYPAVKAARFKPVEALAHT